MGDQLLLFRKITGLFEESDRTYENTRCLHSAEILSFQECDMLMG
jgi:hypothetical protein